MIGCGRRPTQIKLTANDGELSNLLILQSHELTVIGGCMNPVVLMLRLLPKTGILVLPPHPTGSGFASSPQDIVLFNATANKFMASLDAVMFTIW